MRQLLIASVIIVTTSGLAFAHKNARAQSEAGQAPEVLDHEPGPAMRLNRFQILLIDDHTCPAGQIKQYTAGSKSLGIAATRECISR